MTGMDKKAAESLLKNIGKGVAEPLLKGVLFIVFWLLENFYVDDKFKCPCYSTIETREENCIRSKIYSSLFMILTTVAAGFLGFFALAAIKFVVSCGRNPDYSEASQQTEGQSEGRIAETSLNTSTSNTDDVQQHGRDPAQNNGSKLHIYYGFRSKYCFKKFFEAFVIGFAWFCLLLIDGDYTACAVTCNPYGNATCTEIRGLPHDERPVTADFAWMRRISQYIGFGLAFLVLLMISIKKFCHMDRCCKSQCSRCTDGAYCACCTCCVCQYSENLAIKEKEQAVEDILLGFKDIAQEVAVKVVKDHQSNQTKTSD